MRFRYSTLVWGVLAVASSQAVWANQPCVLAESVDIPGGRPGVFYCCDITQTIPAGFKQYDAVRCSYGGERAPKYSLYVKYEQTVVQQEQAAAQAYGSANSLIAQLEANLSAKEQELEAHDKQQTPEYQRALQDLERAKSALKSARDALKSAPSAQENPVGMKQAADRAIAYAQSGNETLSAIGSSEDLNRATDARLMGTTNIGAGRAGGAAASSPSTAAGGASGSPATAQALTSSQNTGGPCRTSGKIGAHYDCSGTQNFMQDRQVAVQAADAIGGTIVQGSQAFGAAKVGGSMADQYDHVARGYKDTGNMQTVQGLVKAYVAYEHHQKAAQHQKRINELKTNLSQEKIQQGLQAEGSAPEVNAMDRAATADDSQFQGNGTVAGQHGYVQASGAANQEMTNITGQGDWNAQIQGAGLTSQVRTTKAMINQATAPEAKQALLQSRASEIAAREREIQGKMKAAQSKVGNFRDEAIDEQSAVKNAAQGNAIMLGIQALGQIKAGQDYVRAGKDYSGIAAQMRAQENTPFNWDSDPLADDNGANNDVNQNAVDGEDGELGEEPPLAGVGFDPNAQKNGDVQQVFPGGRFVNAQGGGSSPSGGGGSLSASTGKGGSDSGGGDAGAQYAGFGKSSDRYDGGGGRNPAGGGAAGGGGDGFLAQLAGLMPKEQDHGPRNGILDYGRQLAQSEESLSVLDRNSKPLFNRVSDRMQTEHRKGNIGSK